MGRDAPCSSERRDVNDGGFPPRDVRGSGGQRERESEEAERAAEITEFQHCATGAQEHQRPPSPARNNPPPSPPPPEADTAAEDCPYLQLVANRSGLSCRRNPVLSWVSAV